MANAPGTGADDLLGLHQPEGHGVHKRIAAVARIKGHLTAHGGNSHAVAVVGDARHHPLHQADVAGLFKGPEAQGVEEGDRPSAHGEDVPKDASHPGGGPLKRLDGRWMVVALDLEGQPLALAQVHHAGVLARAHQDAGAAGGELAEQGAGVSVAAVLRPHHAEHAELGPVRSPAQPSHDLVVISLAEPFLAQRFGHRKGRRGDHQRGHAGWLQYPILWFRGRSGGRPG